MLRGRNGRYASVRKMVPYSGMYDPIAQNRISKQLGALVENSASLLRRTGDGADLFDDRRDINHECGFPGRGQITIEDYAHLYERESIAARVVEILPDESWRVQPTIVETEDEDLTPFEQAVMELDKSLQGDQSWYQPEDQQGSPVWTMLHRVDVLSGIGSFGVLLLGIDDGLDLTQPVVGVEESNSFDAITEEVREGIQNGKLTYNLEVDRKQATKRRLIYLRAFSEENVQITRFESNPTSPRFGLPIEYSLQFDDPNEKTNRTGLGSHSQYRTRTVHWTRVVHVAEQLKSSEVYAIPRMRPVYNNLMNLRKILHGDAESYWRNVVMKIFFETHPQLGGDVEINTSDMADEMEEMLNGLQQWMALKGMSANTVAPSVVDPQAHMDIQIDAICVKLAVPKRKLLGSERGELASSQDEDSWNDRLKARQMNYLTPRIIVPFFDRLIMIGVLPEPAEGYRAIWPDLGTSTDMELAEVASKRTEAMAKYVQGGVDNLMEPMDYLVRELNYTQSEAEEILKNALKRLEEKAEEQQDLMEEQQGQFPQDPDVEDEIEEDDPTEPVEV